MSHDIQTSFLTYVHGILTADATLKAAMGGTVRLYPVWAVSDPTTPYLVHRIEFQANFGEWVTRSGTYILDIWSTTDSAAEALAIKDRITTLLDELSFNTTDTVKILTGCRLWSQTEGLISEEDESIWHYMTQWNFRGARAIEVTNIVNR